MLEHEQNMIALNDHLQMTRLRQQKRFVNPLLSMNSDMCLSQHIANEKFSDYFNPLIAHLSPGQVELA